MRGASNKHAGKGGCGPFGEKTNLVVYGEKGNRRFWKGPKIRKRQGPSVWVWPSVRPFVCLGLAVRLSIRLGRLSVWVWPSVRPFHLAKQTNLVVCGV